MRRRTLLLLVLALLVTWLAASDRSARDSSPAPPKAGDERPAAVRSPEDATTSAPPDREVPPVPVEPGSGILLTGRVTLKPEGTPAEYALVRLVADDEGLEGPGAEVLADSGGAFRVEDAPEGSWRLRVWFPERVEYVGPKFVLPAGAQRTGLEIGLIRGGSLVGTVTGTKGIPVSRRPVLVETPSGTSLRALTDIEGGYEFRSLSPGRLRIRPEGISGTWVDLADGETVRRDFIVPQPATLTIRIVDRSDEVVHGIVLLRRPGEEWHDDGYRTGPLPCRFELLPAGVHEIWAAGCLRKIALAEGEERTETFRVETASVGGRAIFERDAKGREVWAWLDRVDLPPAVGPLNARQERTAPDGTFRLVGIPPGEYEISAFEGEAESNALPLTLRPGDSRQNLLLRVREEVWIAVKLVNLRGTNPLMVTFSLYRGTVWVATGTAGPDGRGDVPTIPGRYTLKLFLDGSEESAAEKEIEVLGNDRNEFEIELR